MYIYNLQAKRFYLKKELVVIIAHLSKKNIFSVNIFVKHPLKNGFLKKPFQLNPWRTRINKKTKNFLNELTKIEYFSYLFLDLIIFKNSPFFFLILLSFRFLGCTSPDILN